MGITALSLFFAFGAAMAFTAAVSLAFPDSWLEHIWRLKPRARAAFASLGPWAAVLMFTVSVACAASAIGLWRGTRWGWFSALGMLALQLIGDVLNVLLGVEPRAVVGIPIVGVLVAYLFSRRIRWFFTTRRVAP